MIVRLVYRRVVPEKVLAGTEVVENRWWWGGGGGTAFEEKGEPKRESNPRCGN